VKDLKCVATARYSKDINGVRYHLFQIGGGYFIPEQVKDGDVENALTNINKNRKKDEDVVMYKDHLYGAYYDNWYKLIPTDKAFTATVSGSNNNPTMTYHEYETNNVAESILSQTRENIKKYKTGGLADFTGPAWLDGTPSKPEYILNATQTERFFSLVDVLEGFDDKKTSTNNNNDISVDVDINVESIGSDYDVEQLANKIRSMLRDDAMYRNVNNINQVR
jgi:hypothetical protein